MDKTIAFYKNVLGLQVAMDFGANKVLTGGLALQTLDTYREFIGTDDISFGGNHFEIYFEEDEFDKFANNLRNCNIQYVHPVKEHADMYPESWTHIYKLGGTHGCFSVFYRRHPFCFCLNSFVIVIIYIFFNSFREFFKRRIVLLITIIHLIL